MVRRLLCAVALVAVLAACADVVTDLPPYGSIEVDAQRRNGDPVPGAHLTVYTGARPMGYATTGADGAYVFRFLPKGQYGVYAAPPEGYARPEELLGGPTTAYIDKGLGLEEGEHKSATFTYLKIGDGVITVHVTEPGGAPIAGVAASLYNPASVVETDATDVGGTVRFDPVPYGNWGVSLVPPRRYRDVNEFDKRVDGLIVEEGTEDSVDVHFQPCEGVLRAVVRDGQGAAVAGYPLQLYDADAVVADGTTSGDGIGVFSQVGCGVYGIRLGRLDPWSYTEGRGQSYLDGLLVHRGTDQTVSFTVARCVGSIHVLVRDGAGVAVTGAGLTLYDSRSALAQATSDATGTHVFGDLACTTEFGVKVQPPAGYSVTQGRGSSYFDGLRVTDGGEALVVFKLNRN